MRLRPLLFPLWLALAGAPAFADELKDCLESAGEISPHAEELARQIHLSLGKDGFLHRGYISPAELRMHDTKKLAEMLVARLDAECEKPRTPASSAAVDSEIVMMVSDKHLESIVKLGFQNQHMTSSTGGCNCALNRFKQEQSMITMHLPYSHKARDLLPKYSAFNLKTEGMGKFALPTPYGNFALVMKPEVKKRTTFTFNDSLGMGFGRGEDHYPPRTTDYKKPTDGRKPPQCEGYCEAQIWGPLEMGDVAQIMVPKGTVVTENLKKLGIPIVEFESPDFMKLMMRGHAYPGTRPGEPDEKLMTADGQTALYKKGEKLFEGSPGKVPAPAQFSRKTLEESRASAGEGSALQNIYGSRLLEKMPDAELLQKFKDEQEREKNPPPATPDRWMLTMMGGPFKDSEKIFSELAARPLTPAIEKALMDERKSDSALIRHQALIGLSGLPAEKLKPLILEALDDKEGIVKALAVSMAADFPKDEKVQEKMLKITNPSRETDPMKGYGGIPFSHDPSLKELANRLARKKFCDSGMAPNPERQ